MAQPLWKQFASHKGKHRVINWPSISTPKCIPKRTESMFIQKLKHDCSKTTQMSISWSMDKQHVVHTHSGLLLLAVVEQLADFSSVAGNEPGLAVKAGILTTRPWGNSSYNWLFRNKKEWWTDTCCNMNRHKNITLGFKSQLQKAINCMIPFIWFFWIGKSKVG